MKILWNSKGKGRNKVPMVRVDNPEFYGRKNKMIDARLYFYKMYHPNEETKGYVILHLDADISNFAKENLVKVNQRTWLLIQNQKLWTDNIELNKIAINFCKLQDLNKTIRNKTGKERTINFQKELEKYIKEKGANND